METNFYNILDIPTAVMTFGKSIEDTLQGEKELVLCIPGNPGMPGFYTQFLETVHRRIGERIPIWMVGHAGHDEPISNTEPMPPLLKGNEEKYGLRGQVLHKIEFIKKYIPESVKIYLVGHSIASYCILEMLREPEVTRRLKQAFLLFPTFERMAITRNGIRCQRMLFPMESTAVFLGKIFAMLPDFIKIFLIHIYCIITSTPHAYNATIIRFLRPTIGKNLIFLAREELRDIHERPNDVIQANINLLKFYYGTTDGWVPVKYFKELKEAIPNVNAELNLTGIDHAFMMKSSVEMGEIVGKWIAEFPNKVCSV